MTEEASLLLLFAGFYVWQSIHWFRPRAVAFRARGVRDFVLVDPNPAALSRFGLPILGHLWPPFGSLFALAPWPLALGRDGLTDENERSWSRLFRPAGAGQFLRYEEIKTAGFDGAKIRINGEVFTEALDEVQAQAIVLLLRKLRDADAESRERLIKAHLQASLDTQAASARVDAALREAGRIRFWAHLLVFSVFLVLPVITYTEGLAKTWWWLVPSIFALNFVTALRFRAAHARLYPSLRYPRIEAFVTMLLFFPQTMRAHDLITKSALSDLHLLAVTPRLVPAIKARAAHETSAASKAAELEGEARRTEDEVLAFLLRDLKEPIQRVDGFSEDIEKANADARVRETGVILEVVSRDRLERAASLPDPSESYCPRCYEPIGDAPCDVCRIPA